MDLQPAHAVVQVNATNLEPIRHDLADPAFVPQLGDVGMVIRVHPGHHAVRNHRFHGPAQDLQRHAVGVQDYAILVDAHALTQVIYHHTVEVFGQFDGFLGRTAVGNVAYESAKSQAWAGSKGPDCQLYRNKAAVTPHRLDLDHPVQYRGLSRR